MSLAVVREDTGRIWASGRKTVRADGHVVSIENALRSRASKLSGDFVAA